MQSVGIFCLYKFMFTLDLYLYVNPHSHIYKSILSFITLDNGALPLSFINSVWVQCYCSQYLAVFFWYNSLIQTLISSEEQRIATSLLYPLCHSLQHTIVWYGPCMRKYKKWCYTYEKFILQRYTRTIFFWGVFLRFF